MTDYSKMVKAPGPDSINTGLSACRATTLLAAFGRPGRLSEDCSPITGTKLLKSIVTLDVGPFRLTGHKTFLGILSDIFQEIIVHDPDLYAQIHTAGCLCCRHIRGIPAAYSNHSFGTAVDVYFGKTNDFVGDGKCQLGLLALYPYMHPHGLYWGAEFGKNNPAREDSMHFEMSDELVRKTFL